MNEKKISTSTIAMIALMTAVTCILGPLSVPIGPVPISLTNLAIYFTVILLGWKKGTVSYVIYLLIGLVGVPVFSSFSAGPAKLFGPTGGYLIGFIFLAMISGWFIEKFPGKRVMYFVGMVLGTAVCYALGTAWLAYENFHLKIFLIQTLVIQSNRILKITIARIPTNTNVVRPRADEV